MGVRRYLRWSFYGPVKLVGSLGISHRLSCGRHQPGVLRTDAGGTHVQCFCCPCLVPLCRPRTLQHSAWSQQAEYRRGLGRTNCPDVQLLGQIRSPEVVSRCERETLKKVQARSCSPKGLLNSVLGSGPTSAIRVSVCPCVMGLQG